MEPEESIHTEATLLPGFVSRTLSKDEQQQVERHLKTCSACQQELQEVTAMQSAIKTAIHQRQGPSPAAFAKVMSQIHQETKPASQVMQLGAEPSWWEQLENVFRSLFEVRWAPALASFLIVGQAVLLLSVLGGPGGQGGVQNGQITERGIPQGIPVGPPLKIQIQFVETAQESQIRKLIQDLNGRIIDGPTPEGRYTLGFQLQAGVDSDSLLRDLMKHPDLVQSATSLGS